MSKEQYATNLPAQSNAGTTNDASNSSVPPRVAPYRSISAKRPRDPSHRKSVSFNDVPIVYEVPSHDIMRSSNADVYRSWIYTDATSPSSVVPSLYSTQTISPLNSTSTTAQKLHANRLSSALYATSSTLITPNRMPDWALRTKGLKPTSATEETHATNENHAPTNSNAAVVVPPYDDKLNKDTAVKSNNPSPYTHPYMIHSAQSIAPVTSSTSSSSVAPESHEEKKYPYRTPVIPETEYVRGLSLTNGASTNTAPTYASILASNLSQTTQASNEQPTYPNSRAFRARSAMTPSTANQPSMRTNEPISIGPFRATATTSPFSTNTSTSAARTVLRPSTVAFQCPQPTAPPTSFSSFSSSSNTNPMNYPSTVPPASTPTSSFNTTNFSSTTSSMTTKPPTAPPRFSPSAATAAAAHSRIILPQNRTLTTAALSAAAMRYTFAHPTNDSAYANTILQQHTIQKPPPTAYPRSRSANVLGMRRASASHVAMMDGHMQGGPASSSTDPTSNLYATTRRSPNVRQNYGSYYLHRVLLPTTTH